MTPHQIRRAAAWLYERAQVQGLREAEIQRERLKLRARVGAQPRDDRGRWQREKPQPATQDRP